MVQTSSAIVFAAMVLCATSTTFAAPVFPSNAQVTTPPTHDQVSSGSTKAISKHGGSFDGSKLLRWINESAAEGAAAREATRHGRAQTLKSSLQARQRGGLNKGGRNKDKGGRKKTAAQVQTHVPNTGADIHQSYPSNSYSPKPHERPAIPVITSVVTHPITENHHPYPSGTEQYWNEESNTPPVIPGVNTRPIPGVTTITEGHQPYPAGTEQYQTPEQPTTPVIPPVVPKIHLRQREHMTTEQQSVDHAKTSGSDTAWVKRLAEMYERGDVGFDGVFGRSFGQLEELD